METTLILVTLISLTLAATMSAVAWRVVREERRRSEARLAALAAEIEQTSADRPLRVEGAARAPRAAMNDLPLRDASIPSLANTISATDLFAVAQSAEHGSRLLAVVAVGLFVVGSAAALAVVLSSGSQGVADPARVGQSSTAARAEPGSSRTPQAADAVPLELVALGHEREGDRLTVRGVVRNPASGAALPRLTAVVFLFNRDGGFVASGRAMVDASSLAPGSESPFVVTVPGAADVGRYRVSFRAEDRLVPHVDRRDRGAMAQLK